MEYGKEEHKTNKLKSLQVSLIPTIFHSPNLNHGRRTLFMDKQNSMDHSIWQFELVTWISW